MYTRIGILGRARQAIGIARLHAPREALYIDVKYNSHSHSRTPSARAQTLYKLSYDAEQYKSIHTLP
jgi:hypothetical protein